MHPRFILPALAALLSAAACETGPRTGTARTYTDPAQTIRVAAGTPFRLALTSNHSTGYRWVLVDSAALGPLRSAGSRYAVPRRYRDHDGAGGMETWTFQAPHAGAGTVALVYVCPAVPRDTLRFRVVAE